LHKTRLAKDIFSLQKTVNFLLVYLCVIIQSQFGSRIRGFRILFSLLLLLLLLLEDSQLGSNLTTCEPIVATQGTYESLEHLRIPGEDIRNLNNDDEIIRGG
jgi:hypothetical protein